MDQDPDPDPELPEKSDPNPEINFSDPTHWFQIRMSLNMDPDPALKSIRIRLQVLSWPKFTNFFIFLLRVLSRIAIFNLHLELLGSNKSMQTIMNTVKGL